MDELEWGVFRVADTWFVVGGDGVRHTFPSRALALSAAETLVRALRAAGRDVKLTVQDEAGRLINVQAPHD